MYDQRQNGTENYRINLNGVIVLLAPAETVLQVAQLANLDNEIENINKPSSQLRPKPRPPSPKISNDDESSKKTETEMKNPLR